MNQVKKFSLNLSPDEAKELLTIIPDDFRSSHSSLVARINTFAEVDQTLGKGRNLDDHPKKQSAGHQAVAKVLTEMFPLLNMKQNTSVKLIVKGRETTCEFDFVIKALATIIEVQGKQHSSYVPHFHNGDFRNFTAQQDRDQAKLAWAEENGWTVVEITDVDARSLGKMELDAAKRHLSQIIAEKHTQK